MRRYSMRRLAVSDIHGEGRRLVQVLAKAEYDPNHDKLFLLGDYIDRGSDVKFTVDLVRQLVKDGAVALKGNHDAMPGEVSRCKDGLSCSGDLSWWVHRNGGDATYRSYEGIPPQDVIDWLDSLPIYHEEDDVILVHAGFVPGIPVSEQPEGNLLWIRDEFYNYYNGPKTVVFGHTPTYYLHSMGDNQFVPWHSNHCVGIDTGAAYGGPLTLVDIDTWQTWTA
jgi:serine/threonine protein phosphatase 1